MRPNLIFVGGEAWTGKTTCARLLYKRFDNSACLDGDDVWRVHPWRLDDPRLRTSDVTAAFVLQTYLRSGFAYVVFSSITLCVPAITHRILERIAEVEYDLLHFTLVADGHVLAQRAVLRDNNRAVEFLVLEQSRRLPTIQIDGTDKAPEQVVDEMVAVINDPKGAGLVRVDKGAVAEWLPPERPE